MPLQLLFIGLAIATLLGWMYFWVLCISSAEKLLKPIFGRAAFGVACIGFPIAFFGLLYVLLHVFGREAGKWFFVVLGALLPLIGIWAIKKQRL